MSELSAGSSSSTMTVRTQPRVPILSRIVNGAIIYGIQNLSVPLLWGRDWYSWWYPKESAPSLVKTYECRPSLPVRIFFPKSYDQMSAQTLPTVFMLHGGGFCVGSPNDDDEWNAPFASEHNLLVVELNYRKAPGYPFPTPIYDAEALLLAVFGDESLPIDKDRVAIGGFSAGGAIALCISQLPSVREEVKPQALLALYPVVDMTVGREKKLVGRQYKPSLGPGIRGNSTDYLKAMSPAFNWSYVPVGQKLDDPLLSPIFLPRDRLPSHIYVVGCELDMLAHEDWRMACKLAGRPQPPLTQSVGQEQVAAEKGALILDDERYAFEQVDAGGKTSVRWLLIPDQVHGFDHLPPSWHGEESYQDSKFKMAAYQKLLGEWLHNSVWKA